MAPDGTFTTFTGPNGEAIESAGGINSNGEVAGMVGPGDLFVRHTDGTFLTHPNPTIGPAVVTGVNVADEVTGTDLPQYGSISNLHSFSVPFLWSNTLMRFAVNAGTDSSYAAGINDSGVVVGFEKSATSAFQRTTDGIITTFQVGALETTAWGINNSGVICGASADVANSEYGYVRLP
jgi:uncharacterized membrane protein